MRLQASHTRIKRGYKKYIISGWEDLKMNCKKNKPKQQIIIRTKFYSSKSREKKHNDVQSIPDQQDHISTLNLPHIFP